MTELRLVEGDWIELENVRIARLIPGLAPTIVYRLTEAIDSIGEDEATIADLESEIELKNEYIAELEARVAQLEKRLKETTQ